MLLARLLQLPEDGLQQPPQPQERGRPGPAVPGARTLLGGLLQLQPELGRHGGAPGARGEPVSENLLTDDLRGGERSVQGPSPAAGRFPPNP